MRQLAALAALLFWGMAIAQDTKQPPGWLERRLESIDRAIARLETKLSGREAGGMMEGCRDMMGGGMMGGGGMKGGAPNDQWRPPANAR